MPATLTKTPLNTVPLNTYSVDAEYTCEAPGAYKKYVEYICEAPGTHKRFQAFTIKAPGIYDNTIHTYRIRAIGAKRQLNTFTLPAPGKHSIAIIHVKLKALGAHRRFASMVIEAPGASSIRNEFSIESPGLFRIQLPFEITAPGKYQRGLGHFIQAPGVHAVAPSAFTRVYRQRYHVEDASLDRWELYVGVNGMPDFEAVDQPVATSDTSPIVWAPPLPGAGLTHVLYIVVRKRTSLGFLDFNQHPKLIEIDENGDEVLGPLTDPELVRVLDGALSGSIQAWGSYAWGGDRNPADSWELYAKLGADPVVGTDAPLYTVAMAAVGDGNALRRMAAQGLTAGATYHVMVAVRRAADGAVATSDVGTITLIPVYDIVADDVVMFAGDEYEINQ